MKLLFCFLFACALIATVIYADEENGDESTVRRARGGRRGARRRARNNTTRDALEVESDIESDSASEADCSKTRQISVSRCMIRGQILGLESFVPPRTEEELDKVCRRVSRSNRCALRYTKECLTGFPAQVAKVMLQTTKVTAININHNKH